MENREQEIRQDREDLIEGRNAVAEAIRAGRTIDKIFVARGDTDRTLARILAKARENGIVVTECDRRKLDSLSATGAHQGIIAQAAMREYASIEDILERAAEPGRGSVHRRVRRDRRSAQSRRDFAHRRVRGRPRRHHPQAARRRAHRRGGQGERGRGGAYARLARDRTSPRRSMS